MININFLIPIIIICYNNYKYVHRTIEQINRINPTYLDNIIILNNDSNDENTINYLNLSNHNIINNKNNGPWIDKSHNTHIYNSLPDKFIITDPDLEFNKCLPNNFIEIMIELSNQYECDKIGFALSLDNHENMFCDKYIGDKTIYEWEKQFWDKKIHNTNYDLYQAPIDTTFCLVNKNGTDKQIRIGGNFTAKHSPWYKDNNILNIYDEYCTYYNQPNISTTRSMILSNILHNYKVFTKNKEKIFIKNIYMEWANPYTLLDTTLFDTMDKNKIYIEISNDMHNIIYASRNCKHAFFLTSINQTLLEHCNDNSTNITFIDSYDIDLIGDFSNVGLIYLNINNNKIINKVKNICKKYKIYCNIYNEC